MPRHTYLAPHPGTEDVYLFTEFTPVSMIEKQLEMLGWEVDQWEFLDNPGNSSLFYLAKRSRSTCKIH